MNNGTQSDKVADLLTKEETNQNKIIGKIKFNCFKNRSS